MTTIRTIKLKKSLGNPSDLASLGGPETEETKAVEAPASSPAAGLASAAAAPSGKRSTFTLFAVFGLFAMIALCVILGLQVSELSFYAADPSVWPLK
jgi:hypothetical protein